MSALSVVAEPLEDFADDVVAIDSAQIDLFATEEIFAFLSEIVVAPAWLPFGLAARHHDLVGPLVEGLHLQHLVGVKILKDRLCSVKTAQHMQALDAVTVSLDSLWLSGTLPSGLLVPH